MVGMALSSGASRSTIWGDFPPSSTCSGMRFLAHASITFDPVSGEPVKLIRRTSGCAGSAAPASVP